MSSMSSLSAKPRSYKYWMETWMTVWRLYKRFMSFSLCHICKYHKYIQGHFGLEPTLSANYVHGRNSFLHLHRCLAEHTMGQNDIFPWTYNSSIFKDPHPSHVWCIYELVDISMKHLWWLMFCLWPLFHWLDRSNSSTNIYAGKGYVNIV